MQRRSQPEEGTALDKHANQAGLSLVFGAGTRPSADDVEHLLTSAISAGTRASISFRPPDDEEGLLELLVSGLTFDLRGLHPGRAMPIPPRDHVFGFAEGLSREPEAITLLPGQHISGGFAMLPIVQAMIGLAEHMAVPLGAEAVCWHPARSWMEPQYFSRLARNWLSGGPFPALGLTALAEGPRGVRSEGLGFFAGQELQVDTRAGEQTARTAKLAIRIVDHIVHNGPFTEDVAFEGPDGELLRIELSNAGGLAAVRRGK